MQAERTDRVYITRSTRGEMVNDKPRPPRVYITGPHYGSTIFSSTADRAEADTFTRAEAERLLASGKWMHQSPRIEDADA